MLNNYLKTAWRNTTKNRFSSIINIGGLAVGIGVSILIGLWVWDELSFNKYHERYNRIARVMQHQTNNGEVRTQTSVPYPLAAELRKNYAADFKYVVLSSTQNDNILSVGDKRLIRRGVYFEPQAPHVFTLKMLHGTRDGLRDPASILISESTAEAFFGDEDPMNKMMRIDNRMDVKVTGVYEDLPRNTTLNGLQFIAPWDLYFANTEWVRTSANPWRPNAFEIYTVLNDRADAAVVSLKIKDEKLKHMNQQLALKKPELFLMPMSKWRLYSEYRDGVNVGGRIKYVWLFSFIGFFVLLLACINFMNLSTAQSEKRAKEVGIRKAIGSLRRQLVNQFFTESILIVALSFLVSLVFVQLLLPFFNGLSEKSVAIPIENPFFWCFAVLFVMLTGILAGSYPAFYLSSFHPVKILKGTLKAGRGAALPRKVMVVLQFTISVMMIIGTIVVFRQIQYAKDRPIGYENNGLISVPVSGASVHQHIDAIRSELQNSRVITALAETGNPITQVWGTSSGFDWKGKDPNLSVDFPRVDVSYDYGKTVGWQLLAGRDFSRDFATDSTALILNESAVRFMGLQNPVGETIKWFDEPYTVIGVVSDLIMQSPYENARPGVFSLYTGAQDFVLMRINPAISVKQAISKIEPVFKANNPSEPFRYRFVDEEFEAKFSGEETLGKLAGFFALLAIFISCLGLFGMSLYMAERRTKEIGIRKVLGASVASVWHLLSKDFLVLVCIALLIAMPLSYYFMHGWLQSYTYRANIAWWIFAIAGTGAIILTLATVSVQAFRAALTNPSKSLRSE